VLFGNRLKRRLRDTACAAAVARQALRNHKGRVPGSTRSSLRAIHRELIRAACRLRTDCSFLHEMSLDTCGVEPEVVTDLATYVEDRIRRMREVSQRVRDYRHYLNEMVRRGARTSQWAASKLETYKRQCGLGVPRNTK
jgi:hypothetical protein